MSYDDNSIDPVLDDTCGRYGLEVALADTAISSARPAVQRAGDHTMKRQKSAV
jgi:hypothetical protein